MHVVIMGCGRAGSRLARRLEHQGHSVAVIDKDPRSFHLLDVDFKGKKVKGVGFDAEVLVDAGIEKADAFVAVGSGDNSNIVSSVIAKDVFHVPRVITRIYDPRRANIYRRFGIPTVSPVRWGVNRILDLLFLEHSHSRDTFGNGEVELMEFELPGNLAGRSVRDFEIPGELHVATIERFGQASMPLAGTRFEKGDLLNVLVSRASMQKFNKMFFMV
ncbi:MAG: TrkA family potassium uptake protein [Actinobacteria bacterium]|nr:TrkA family potassium uptake protein [Actinomycetota bacterium]